MTTDKRVRINCCLERGRLFHAEGKLEQAQAEVGRALAAALATRFVNEQADCYRERARLAYESGDEGEAKGCYEKALEIFQRHGYWAKAEALQKEIAEKFPQV